MSPAETRHHVRHTAGVPAPGWLIVCAMLAGIALGICGQLRAPIEERLLDGSLVLAGQVAYPKGAILDLYYHGVWTLLYQLGALILKAGASYTTANYVFQLIPPALLTTALAMFIHGLTGRPLFSLVAAALCFMNGYFVSLFASSDYPLLGMAWNQPSPHSYGRFGAMLAAFAFAALVGGRDALAAFAGVVAISVHPVIGAYTVTMLACGLGVAHIAWGRPVSRRIYVGFAAGMAVTLASFAAFLAMRHSMPVVDEAKNLAYVEVYSSLWDYHRNLPATLSDLRRALTLAAILAIPLGVFLALRQGRRTSADAGAAALLSAIVVSTTLYIMTHWAKQLLPDIVLRTIPGRLINMQAPFAMAVFVGMAVFLFDEIARRFGGARGPDSPGPLFFRFPNVVAAIVAACLAVRVVPGFVSMIASASSTPDVVAAHRELEDIDSPFWSQVRARKIDRVVLVPSDIAFAALRYGRLPIALETVIDFIPYLPRTATMLAGLIERGYGISFLHPPDDMKFRGIMPPGTGREYWACLSPDQWYGVAREFDLGAILVPKDWTVRLPLLLSDDRYALYAMPSAPTRADGPIEPPCPIRRG